MDGKAVMRRKASTSSTSSKLQTPRSSQSCPSSPRHSKNLRTTPSLSSTTLNEEDFMPSTSRAYERTSNGLHRSPSSVSQQYRARSGPSGLHSYTGSQPPSRGGSRTDLTEERQTGSVSMNFMDDPSHFFMKI